MRFLFLASTIFATGALAQVVPPFTCVANTTVVPLVRLENLTDLVGDLLLNCTGGTQGQPVLADFKVSFNTTVTSRLVNPNSILSEAYLLVDDPAPGNQTLGTNAFLGSARGLNGLSWTGVPISVPGTGGTRLIRFTNVRVDPSQLPVGSDIQAFVSVSQSDGTAIPITNPTLVVGTKAKSTEVSVGAGSAPSASATAGLFFNVNFKKLIPNAWRVRDVGVLGTLGGPPVQQNQIPRPGNTESGFSSFALNPEAGFAGSGTILWIAVSGIPPGNQLSFPGIVAAGGDSFRLISNAFGTGTAVPLDSNNRATPTPINGSVLIGYEATSVTSNLSIVTFGINESYPANLPLPSTALLRVQGGMGPLVSLGNHLAAGNRPVPLFDTYVDDTETPSKVNLVSTNSLVEAYAGAEVRSANQGESSLSTPAQDFLLPEFVISPDPVAKETTWSANTAVFSDFVRGNGLAVNQQTDTFAPGLFGGIRAGTTNWLTATLSQTLTPATVNVSVNPAGLQPGTYKGSVTVSSTTQGVNPVTVPVTMKVPPANGPVIKSLGFGIGNFGSYASNKIAPGEGVVVFGSNLGPAQIVTLKLTNGVTDTILGGTRVLFDGVPAPMIYAVDGVVSCFVPFGVAGKKFVVVEVEYNGVKSPPVRVPVAAAVPGLLTADYSGGGQGSFQNVDYSFNGDAGSLPGDFVIMYGTGGGETVPAALDGRVNAGGSLKATVRKVFLDGVEIPFDYFGPAPGQVEGMFQVNIKLPSNVRRNANVPVVVQVGDYKSQPGVTIRVK